MGLLLCKDELLEEKVVAQKFLDVSSLSFIFGFSLF